MKVVLWDKEETKTQVLVSDSKCCPLGTLMPDGTFKCHLLAAAPGAGLCPCDDTLPEKCPLRRGPVFVKKIG